MSKKQNIVPRNDKGQLHGLVITYRSNGELYNIERYVNGIEHGIWEYYWWDGRLILKSYTNNSKSSYSECYDNPNLIEFRI